MQGRLLSSFGNVQRGLVPAVVLAVAVITYWRIWYGIDLTDESFYVVEPYRFVLGARPFVDETSVTQQTTAILVYPFVRAYYAVVGMTGMVLFVRHLQFILSLLVAVAVYGSLRLVLDVRRALLIATAAAVFVPFTIHSLSYNSVGSSLFTAGSLLGLRSLLDPGARRSHLLGGLCLGVAAFAYPPLIVPVAVCVGTRLLLAHRRSRREAVEHGLLALGLPLAGMGAVVGTAGLSKVVDDYRRSSRFLGQAGGLTKVHRIAAHEWSTLPLWYLLLPALALLALTWRYRRGLATLVLAALPFLVLPSRLTFFTTSLDYVAHYGWLALPLFFLVRRRKGAVPLFFGVWVPALVAGITTSYSSANGGVNFGVGFFPATIVTSVFLVFAFEEALGRIGRIDLRALAVAPALAVLALLVVSDTVPVYRDSALSKLQVRVMSGPYAGLATSAAKRTYVTRLQGDLAQFGPRCTILFFDDFPAGYLLTKARPDTNGAWVASVKAALVKPYQDALIRYYRRYGYPDVVVVVRRIPYAGRRTGRTEYYRTNEPLLAAVSSRPYRLLRWRRPYAIYERPATGCPSSSSRAPGALAAASTSPSRSIAIRFSVPAAIRTNGSPWSLRAAVR